MKRSNCGGGERKTERKRSLVAPDGGVNTRANDLCSLLGLDDLGDAVVHFLDGLELGQAHATLVRDVIDAALGFGVLSTGSADLQVVLGGNFFETSVVGGQLWHLDVD